MTSIALILVKKSWVTKSFSKAMFKILVWKLSQVKYFSSRYLIPPFYRNKMNTPKFYFPTIKYLEYDFVYYIDNRGQIYAIKHNLN